MKEQIEKYGHLKLEYLKLHKKSKYTIIFTLRKHSQCSSSISSKENGS